MKSLKMVLGFALILVTAVVLLVFDDNTFAMPIAVALGFVGFALLSADFVATNRSAPNEDWMHENFHRTGSFVTMGLTRDSFIHSDD